MLNFLRQIFKPRYETLNIIKIDKRKLLDNFSYLKNLQPDAEIIPVLKSNAYGHGLKEVCLILNESKARMIAVDSYPEAQIAYQYFKGKVLIIGEMTSEAYRYTKLKRTEFVVYSEKNLAYLSKFGKRAKVHLFFNSGMNREGIQDIETFLKRNQEHLRRVDVVGFCSHLASADEDSPFNTEQEMNFFSALSTLESAGFKPRLVHLGNSAGLFKLQDERLTAFRPGLAFYGYSPFPENINTEIKKKIEKLKPALEVYSKLIEMREVPAGKGVSYNATYIPSAKTKIGVIPFGYYEGLDRRLSNKANLQIFTEGIPSYSKIAGRICMNLSCLEITSAAKIGDLVRIISSNKADLNSIENISKISSTIPYETLVGLNANIRREII